MIMRNSMLGRLSYAALLAGLMAAPGLARAADGAIATNPGGDAPASEGSTTVKGVTVTAAPKPMGATFTEGLIPAEAVREASPGASTTLQTLLNTEPSVYIYSDGPLGVRTNYNFRAFNASLFSETVDGIGLNDVFNGGVSNQASNRNNILLTTNDIDSIQVYRGVNNPSVNSYQSLGGTINFTTRAPAETYGVEADLWGGSFNTVGWRGMLNTGELHGVRQLFAIESASSDGWMKNTDDRNLNIYYAANTRLNDANELSARFVWNWNDGYTPTNMPLAVLASLGHNYMWPKEVEYERNHDTNILGILEWTSHLAPNITFDSKFFAGGSDYKRVSYVNSDYLSGATLPNPGLIPITGPFADPQYGGQMPYYIDNSDFHASRTHHFYGYRAWAIGYTGALTIKLPQNVVTLGGNWTYADLYSREYYGSVDNMPKILGVNDFWDEQDRRTLVSLYAQDEISLFGDRLHVTPGIKFVSVQTHDLDQLGYYYNPAGSDGDIEHYWSPTLGASYKILDNLTVYGALGQNVKFPEISSFYNAVDSGGPGVTPAITLKPEYVTDYEAGVRYQRGGFYVTANIYRDDFQNIFLSGTDPKTGASVTQNGGTARYQGWEFQVSDDLRNVLYGDWHLFLNYAHNEAIYTSSFTDYLTGNTVEAGQHLTNIPQSLLSTGLTYKTNGWRVSLDARSVGSQFTPARFNSEPTPSTIPSFFIVNLGLSKTFDIHAMNRTSQVRIGVNVDNLFDKFYYNDAFTDYDLNGNNFISAIPGAPRSVMGRITIAY
jgi:outer membrane receptor protein involved in Fe transport